MRRSFSLLCFAAILAVAVAQHDPQLQDNHKDSFRFKDGPTRGAQQYYGNPDSLWWNNWQYGVGCCCLDLTCENEDARLPYMGRYAWRFDVTLCKKDCRAARTKYDNCTTYTDEVCSDYADKTTYEIVPYRENVEYTEITTTTFHTGRPEITKQLKPYINRRPPIHGKRTFISANHVIEDPTTKAFIPGEIAAIVSDIRLKNNIVQISSAYPQLGINCYSWQWNQVATQRYNLTGNAQGVIAQEVMHLFPQAVKKGDDGYYRVDYGYLHAKENNSLF